MVSRGALISISVLSMAAMSPTFAQTCLDHDFSDETEFVIQSSSQNAAYRNFLFGSDRALYWTNDVRKLIQSLQADAGEWRATDAAWSANAVALEFSDGGYQCNAAIDDDDLYADAAAGAGQFVRALARSERSRIMGQLNDINRMAVQ
ncbi:hypothetical protein [Hyphococcus sp.]|uniref:hypothetical protein n=1 Tax=Hyphococcus sp. TaxID=2038636 RepID=UPI003D121B56